jgi:hypothetical protein
MAVLPAIAIMIAGCADSRLAASNGGVGAEASGESTAAKRPTPYQTGYGLTSDGPTTDVYTEFFRPNAHDDSSAAAPVSPGAVQQGQPATGSSVAQQEPAKPQAPPAYPTAYGIPSNGPTTDLYTELFGPRSHE